MISPLPPPLTTTSPVPPSTVLPPALLTPMPFSVTPVVPVLLALPLVTVYPPRANAPVEFTMATVPLPLLAWLTTLPAKLSPAAFVSVRLKLPSVVNGPSWAMALVVLLKIACPVVAPVPAVALPVNRPAVIVPELCEMSPFPAIRFTVPLLLAVTLPFEVMPLLLPLVSRSTLKPITMPVTDSEAPS